VFPFCRYSARSPEPACPPNPRLSKAQALLLPAGYDKPAVIREALSENKAPENKSGNRDSSAVFKFPTAAFLCRSYLSPDTALFSSAQKDL
jgi:hypothetical protein